MTLRRVAVLAAFAGVAAANPEFDAASIKPNVSASDMVRLDFHGGRLTAVNVSPRMLIMRAYKLKDFELSGGPGWLDSSRFDIAATGSIDSGEAEFKLMLQSLLASRFKLMVHLTTKEMSVYALDPVPKGSKLPDATANCVPFDPKGPPPAAAPPGQPVPMLCGGFMMDGTHLEGRKISMPQFATALSNMLGRPVIDSTGYNGTFDVHLEFAPEGIAGMNGGGFGAPAALATTASDADSAKQTIFTAIQRQLGLRLKSQNAPVEILVIDSVRKPSD